MVVKIKKEKKEKGKRYMHPTKLKTVYMSSKKGKRTYYKFMKKRPRSGFSLHV